MPNEEKEKERYLFDTLVFYEFFETILRRGKSDKSIVKFIGKYDEIDKFLSIFSVAEIINKLKDAPRVRAYKYKGFYDTVIATVRTLQEGVGVAVVEGDVDKTLTSLIIDPDKLLKYTYKNGSIQDAILLIIADDIDAVFVTDNKHILDAKDIPVKRITINHFTKILEQRYEKRN